MTQFTTDPIETLEDWNAVLVSGGAGFDHCCCEMPSCPVPTRECKSDTADYYATSLDEFEGTKYQTLTQRYWFWEDDGAGPFHEDEEITTTIRPWGLGSGPCGETDPTPSHLIGTPLEGAKISSIVFVSRSDPFDLASVSGR